MNINKDLLKSNQISGIKDSILKKITFNKILMCIMAGIAIIILATPLESLNAISGDDNSGDNEDVAWQSENVSYKDSNKAYTTTEYITYLENRLEECLLKVNGAGKVEVMITLKNNGEKYIYSDIEVSESITKETDSNGGTRQVMQNSEKKNEIYEGEVPYLIKEDMPEVSGVLIISEGGDNPVIEKEINDAAKALFGIESNKIKVMKYK